jgi:putative transposase
MPWKVTDPMSQRLEFVRAVLHRHRSTRALCREFGISEKTGYKWLERFAQDGPAALADRSHAPRVPAHQVPADVARTICRLRERHPTWGARKLRAILVAKSPAVVWPAPSTITALLKAAGLVQARRHRSRASASRWAHPLTTATRPNDVWAADYKGQFRLGTGAYCYPLTVSDLHSRFVLGCHGLPSTASESAQAQFVRLFTRYGLPQVLRTDNGSPFSAPHALAGLSTLAVWWIRLGIRPERSRLGAPQDNGEHERMHRTLKAEATRPASASFEAQQRRFDRWRQLFNDRRPHEALGQTPPAAHFTASDRPYPRRLPRLDYPAHYELRLVSASGHIRWRSDLLFLTRALSHQYVGLHEIADGQWGIVFGTLQLGIYHDELLAIEEQPAWLTPPN